MGDVIVTWLQQNQNIAWIASLVLASGAVWGFMTKYSPKIRKGLKVAEEVLQLCNEILDATSDKVISKEEVEKIAKAIEELQSVLK